MTMVQAEVKIYIIIYRKELQFCIVKMHTDMAHCILIIYHEDQYLTIDTKHFYYLFNNARIDIYIGLISEWSLVNSFYRVFLYQKFDVHLYRLLE